MANNLEIAARQHTHINGRTARLRSALELQYMIQPNDANTILQLGRIYMSQSMDLSELVKRLENIPEVFYEINICYEKLSFHLHKKFIKILGFRVNIKRTGKSNITDV